MKADDGTILKRVAQGPDACGDCTPCFFARRNGCACGRSVQERKRLPCIDRDATPRVYYHFERREA